MSHIGETRPRAASRQAKHRRGHEHWDEGQAGAAATTSNTRYAGQEKRSAAFEVCAPERESEQAMRWYGTCSSWGRRRR